MMPAHQFWWNHLSWNQQIFIKEHAAKQEAQRKLSEDEIISFAYKNRQDWHEMAEWPEDKWR